MLGISLPCIIDRKLLEFSFVYGGSGEKDTTLKIDPNALFKLNKVVGTMD
jgi:prolyl-tRNA editing enzyme YbaK/EbsC (Cys-tRNA(Pro) deacylase)